MGTRKWQRDLDAAEALQKSRQPQAVTVTPRTQLPETVEVFVAEFLDRRGTEFPDGIIASKAAVSELVLRAAEIGRGVLERERFAVAVEVVGSYNERYCGARRRAALS